MKFRSPLLAVALCALAPAAIGTATIYAAPQTVSSSQQAGTKSAAALPQTDARLVKLESLLFSYVNAARQKQGLKPLALDSTLSDIARAHSAEMRDKDYFAHESPTPELRNPLDRYQLGTRSTPRLVAENIFRAWGSRKQISDADALRAHNSLMNSPGHRANILRESPTRIGIGFVANENGDVWVTQMFSRP